jgi:hypothetical protein
MTDYDDQESVEDDADEADDVAPVIYNASANFSPQ